MYLYFINVINGVLQFSLREVPDCPDFDLIEKLKLSDGGIQDAALEAISRHYPNAPSFVIHY